MRVCRTKEAILKDSANGYNDRATVDTLIDIRDMLADIAGVLTQLVAQGTGKDAVTSPRTYAPCAECETTTEIHNPGCRLGHMLD